MDYFFQLLGVVFTHQVQKNISNHIAQLISIGGEGYPQSVAGFHLWWSLPPHPGPLPRNGGEGRVRGFAWKISAILRYSERPNKIVIARSEATRQSPEIDTH